LEKTETDPPLNFEIFRNRKAHLCRHGENEREVAFHYCRAIRRHARIVRIAKRMAKRRALQWIARPLTCWIADENNGSKVKDVTASAVT
jgi:hypothetical protein